MSILGPGTGSLPPKVAGGCAVPSAACSPSRSSVSSPLRCSAVRSAPSEPATPASALRSVDLHDEVGPGLYVKWPLISSVQEFTAKEIAIDLQDLTPKAKDNLSLQDMDVTVYYRANPAAIAELQAKYSGQSMLDEGNRVWMPAYGLVFRVARNVAYEEVARVDSLVMHVRRDELAGAIPSQHAGELSGPTLECSRLAAQLSSVRTDPSIEQSIPMRSRTRKSWRHDDSDGDRQTRGRDPRHRGRRHRPGQPDHCRTCPTRIPAARGQPGIAEFADAATRIR